MVTFNFALAENFLGLLLDVSAHKASIYMLAFSPDGTTLASAGADQSVAIWNTSTWKLVRRIKGESGTVHALTFSPDGNALAAGAENGTIRLWNTSTWTDPEVILVHNSSVRALAFSRDGKRLVSADRDERPQLEGCLGRVRSLFSIDKTDDTIKVWDTSRWSLLHTLSHSRSRVVALDFDPSGQLLARGEEDSEIAILRTETWQTTKRLEFEHGALATLVFNRDGTQLAGGGGRRGLTIWGTTGWAVIEDKTSLIQAIDYKSTKNVLAAGNRNGVVTLLSKIGAKTSELSQNALKSDKSINVMRFSPDGHVLALGPATE